MTSKANRETTISETTITTFQKKTIKIAITLFHRQNRWISRRKVTQVVKKIRSKLTSLEEEIFFHRSIKNKTMEGLIFLWWKSRKSRKK